MLSNNNCRVTRLLDWFPRFYHRMEQGNRRQQTDFALPALWQDDKNFSKTFAFLEKRPLTVKIFKILFRQFYRLTDRCVVFKYREIWPTGNR